MVDTFQSKPRPRRSRFLPIAMTCGLLLVTACVPRLDARGNLPDPDRVVRVEPGIHTRQDVYALLGSPSTIGTFRGEAWYYVSNRTETVAFLEPEVKDRNIIAVIFDPKTGIVKEVRGIGLEDGQDIEVVDRKTRTSGQSVSFFQQVFGNLGKFNQNSGN